MENLKIIILISFTVVGYLNLRLGLFPYLELPGPVNEIPPRVVITTVFCLLHACYAIGWRLTAVFFALSGLVSWGFEQMGVATGLIYGAYEYSEKLGVKIGHVPMLIPLAWFMMIYPSYVISNLIVGGRAFGVSGSLVRLVWISLIGAMVMTAWDLVIDPGMSKDGFWIWKEPGAYFGVPVRNFGGWMLTTFTVFFAYRLLEQRSGLRPLRDGSPAMNSLPVLAYAFIAVRHMVGNEEVALRVVAFFAMGLPLVLALGRLFDSARSQDVR